MNCEICDSGLAFRWTDTHGVGVCCKCGAPYTILHYDAETKERVEKPPELALKDSGAELAKRYWQEKRRMVFPGAYDMGFSSRGGATYSGATKADEKAFYAWLDDQAALAPLPTETKE